MKKKGTSPRPHPPDRDQKQFAAVAKFYDEQSEADMVDEKETSAKDPDTVMGQIPRELLPSVLKLIGKRKKIA